MLRVLGNRYYAVDMDYSRANRTLNLAFVGFAQLRVASNGARREWSYRKGKSDWSETLIGDLCNSSGPGALLFMRLVDIVGVPRLFGGVPVERMPHHRCQAPAWAGIPLRPPRHLSQSDSQ